MMACILRGYREPGEVWESGESSGRQKATYSLDAHLIPAVLFQWLTKEDEGSLYPLVHGSRLITGRAEVATSYHFVISVSLTHEHETQPQPVVHRCAEKNGQTHY